MCGLIYIEDLQGNPVNNALLNQYDKQKSRGREGFGLFDGQFGHIIKSVTEDKILNWLCKYDSNLIMFHHRYPTSTGNIKRAAHPFSTKDHFGDTQYIMVHNGVIRNANELVDKHAELGIEYGTWVKEADSYHFNDSEALLWDFALTMEGKQDELSAEGDMAIIVAKTVDGKLDRLYFGRNSMRPLKIHDDGKTFELSSEGRGEVVKTNTLFEYDYATRQLWEQAFTFPTTPYKPLPLYNHTTFGVQADEEDYLDRYGYQDYPYTPASGASKVGELVRSAAAKLWAPGEVVHVSEEAVATRAFEYMLGANGHFESAYWSVEFDYDDVMEALEDYTPGDHTYRELKREQRLLEQVLYTISGDPEYEDENSISAIIRSMQWQTQTA